MYYPFSWLRSLVKLALYLGVFAIIGWYLDDLLVAVIAGTIGLLMSNYWQLYKLNRWLWHSPKNVAADRYRCVGAYLRRDLLPAAAKPQQA